MPGELFYYVHHDGGGHRGRAAAICRELPTDVTFLSSLPAPADLVTWVPAGAPVRRDWIHLEPDTDHATTYADPTAGGRLHWAPLHQRGLQSRHARVLAEIERRRPALLVADVSVEIAGLARLSGVPTAVVLLPGERSDAPHRWAFDLAVGLLAPWPRPTVMPSWLQPWVGRTCFTGGIPTMSVQPVPPVRPALPGPGGRVLVAFGAGAEPVDEVRAAAASTPGWTWELRADEVGPWPERLAAADVVVAHSGLGTTADLAGLGSRVVVIPQPRPFGEQQATAAMLRDLHVGPVLDRWPDPAAWPDLLNRAAAADPAAWAAWGVRDGARLAAQQLLQWMS